MLAALAAAGPAAAGPDVTTFGFGVQRTGDNGADRSLARSEVSSLRQEWAAPMGGQVNTQPLVAHGVRLASGARTDLVVVGTEAGQLVAVNERTGGEVWRRDLGTARPGGRFGCSAYPGERFGITGTPVVDRSRGRVYAVGGDDRAYAVRLADGGLVSGWPVPVADPRHEHVWGALALSHGLLYAGTASYCDQQPFRGLVVAVDVRSARRVAQFAVTRKDGARPSGGGVWGWGGVSVDPADGDVYAATGNSLTPGEDWGWSERVVRLDSHLRVRQSDHPFTRRTVLDQDFGSTPMLMHPRGCPPMLAALNKDGEMLVYRRDHLARGPLQRLRLAQGASEGGAALLGLPTYVAATRMLYVVSPSDPSAHVHRRGLLAFRLRRDCRLALVWHDPAGVFGLTSAPMTAGGVVYVATGVASRLVAADARTGRTLRTLALGTDGAYAAPTPADGSVLAAGYDGLLRRFTPRLSRPRMITRR